MELYNLKQDVGERRNLATEAPERATTLLQQLRSWREKIKAPMPAKNTMPAQ